MGGRNSPPLAGRAHEDDRRADQLAGLDAALGGHLAHQRGPNRQVPIYPDGHRIERERIDARVELRHDLQAVGFGAQPPGRTVCKEISVGPEASEGRGVLDPEGVEEPLIEVPQLTFLRLGARGKSGRAERGHREKRTTQPAHSAQAVALMAADASTG